MPKIDLNDLPRFEDSWSYLYLEYGIIDGYKLSIAFHQDDLIVPIPVESLCVLMLGPGTSITHEAIKRISSSRCLIAWVGQEGVRLYTSSSNNMKSSNNLIKQISMWYNETTRIEVAKRMLMKRFPGKDYEGKTIEQLRGIEGHQMKLVYQNLSNQYNVPWNGRQYDTKDWDSIDTVNKMISCANSCLYGVVHSAILTCGYSTAIGFIHSGENFSFIGDIADLYKHTIILPMVFSNYHSLGNESPDKFIRYKCRDAFKESRIMSKIIPDIQEVIYGSTSL